MVVNIFRMFLLSHFTEHVSLSKNLKKLERVVVEFNVTEVNLRHLHTVSNLLLRIRFHHCLNRLSNAKTESIYNSLYLKKKLSTHIGTWSKYAIGTKCSPFCMIRVL